MKKLLITGVSGFLGWNCCCLAAERYRVFGLYNSKEIKIPGVQLNQSDICNANNIKELMHNIQADIVIHTAAISAPNICEENRELSRKVNVEASETIARICNEIGSTLVFTSSDLVFDGTRAPFSENDTTNPLNEYGRQKLEAEKRILAIHEKSVICRMPLMYGDCPQGAVSFIIPWIEKFRKGEELKLFTDEFRTPVSARSASEGLLLAAEKMSGIVHLGGKERLSRYEMGQALVKVARLNPNLIKGCSQKDIKMSAPRPADVSLDSSKMFAAGYDPGLFEEELGELRVVK